jgi:hypothetical protein
MQVFLIAGLGRVVLLVLIGLTLCWLLNLPVVAYWLWAVSAYLPMLLAEVLWASSGLSRCRTKDAAASIPSAGSGPVEGRA